MLDEQGTVVLLSSDDEDGGGRGAAAEEDDEDANGLPQVLAICILSRLGSRLAGLGWQQRVLCPVLCLLQGCCIVATCQAQCVSSMVYRCTHARHDVHLVLRACAGKRTTIVRCMMGGSGQMTCCPIRRMTMTRTATARARARRRRR